MDLRSLIDKYLKETKMMQVATVSEGQPWVCTVYFAIDEDLNLYWISTPERRHSKEIQKHSKVAVSVPVKFVPGEDVIGLQMEGTAELVRDDLEIKKAITLYAQRYNRGEEWLRAFIAGKNDHKLYRIKPLKIVLFDEVNFPDDSRQVYEV